jgi:dCTP deaminase
MAFWSREKILAERKNNPALISDFNEERLKYGRYSLRLSREVLVTPDGTTAVPPPGEGSHAKIPPGQFAILFTLESVKVPHDAIGFISVRTSEKWKGLVNISGFHVDPGFIGHLKFTVYNAGNNCICLDYESECFLLWFCSLDRTTTSTWDVNNKFQKALITAADHEQMLDRRHSPAMLHNRIKRLEDNVNLIISVGAVVVFPLLIAFAVPVFEHLLGSSADKVSNSQLIIGVSIVTSLIIVLFLAIYNRWSKNR